MAERRLVVVSGAPGAGKTTIAVPLAAQLGLPLLAKDVIKERLADVIPAQGEPLAWSRILGSAAMELIWRLASYAPAAVLEANFRPRSEYETAQLRTLGGRLLEVYCKCPPELAARRFAERAAGPGHHPIHSWTQLPAEALAEYSGPLALGEVIEVDTTAPVDVPALARAVAARL